MENTTLPPDFLADPAPNIDAKRIDFSTTELLRYVGLYAVILDNVLSAEECENLIRGAEAKVDGKWETAMINIGGGKQRLMEDERCCGRIIWDSPELVDRIWKRISNVPEVEEILRLENVPRIFGNGPAKRNEVWSFSRPNERMRFLKYTGGEYFRAHCDGTYETPDKLERSHFTLHLYLNNGTPQSNNDLKYLSLEQQATAADSTLVGGATTFHSYNMKEKLDVLPVTGRVLLFQHRDLLHSGDDVKQGVKYTMRTDLLYRLEDSASSEQSGEAVRNAPADVNGRETDAKAARKARARFAV